LIPCASWQNLHAAFANKRRLPKRAAPHNDWPRLCSTSDSRPHAVPKIRDRSVTAENIRSDYVRIGLDIFAWIVLVVLAASAVGVFCIAGWLPGHIAKTRGHPF
jgi:hypothetical protein